MTIFITGASRGIGKFLFEKFSSENAKVFGTYHSENQELGKDKRFFRLDVTSFEEASEISETLKSEIEKLVLINCAGNNYNSFAHKASQTEWKNVIDTNLTGTFNVIRAFLNRLFIYFTYYFL